MAVWGWWRSKVEGHLRSPLVAATKTQAYRPVYLFPYVTPTLRHPHVICAYVLICAHLKGALIFFKRYFHVYALERHVALVCTAGTDGFQ